MVHFQNLKEIMIDRSMMIADWQQNVVPKFAVPSTLYEHQVDAMSLVKAGKNVFLGKLNFKNYRSPIPRKINKLAS